MAGARKPHSGEIKSVRKSLRLIELLHEMDGARLSELADHLNWPKSTVHVHLKTLLANGYVAKEADGYALGLRFLDFGEYVKHREDYYSLLEPKLQELAEQTGERVHFVVLDRNACVFVRITEGEHSVNTGSRLGLRRENLHATAAGKAMLATMSNREVRSIIEEEGLPQLTPNTITDEAELFETLNAIRERGYSFNYEEHIEGIRGVSTAITDPDDGLLGAISVGAPVHRMRDDRMRNEIPNTILSIRTGIELEIAHHLGNRRF